MKLRTLDELNNFLSNDIFWRKKELTTAKFIIGKAREHEKVFLIRAGVCIVYAHWEGFVKMAATAYLNYVNKQGLDLDQLCPGILTVSLRSMFTDVGVSKKTMIRIGLTKTLLSGLTARANIPWEDAINTSNLNSEMLKEITCILGIDYAYYDPKAFFIDHVLVSSRNSIAHGDDMALDFKDYEIIHSNVISLVEQFRTDLENAATNKKFLKS